jgi:hypothetical protein
MSRSPASSTISTEQRETRIDEMSCLYDLCQLPGTILSVAGLYTGALVYLTWYIHNKHWELYWMLLWLGFVTTLTLLPIILMRLMYLHRVAIYPPIAKMKPLRDFYKLSDWVYLIMMAAIDAWIVISWVFLSYKNAEGTVIRLAACGFASSVALKGVRLIRCLLDRRM